VGFGDLDFAATLHPTLATVQIDGSRMGATAEKFIVHRVEGRPRCHRVCQMIRPAAYGRRGHEPTPPRIARQFGSVLAFVLVSYCAPIVSVLLRVSALLTSQWKFASLSVLPLPL